MQAVRWNYFKSLGKIPTEGDKRLPTEVFFLFLYRQDFIRKEGKPLYETSHTLKLTGILYPWGMQGVTTQRQRAGAVSLHILHLMSGSASTHTHTGYIP